MKRIFVLLLFMLLCLPVFATGYKLLHSYSSLGIYYLYVPNFNMETFQMPTEIKPVNTMYTVYIYDKNKTANSFKTYEDRKIENKPNDMFAMYLIGLDNKPIGFIHHNSDETVACSLKSYFEQTRYVLNPEDNKWVKQMTFNNGEYGMTSICNPNYLPWQDI